MLAPSWIKRLERLARRRFGGELLAEEAVSYVIDELSRDDWARLQKHHGQACQRRAFVNTVAGNLLEEFARKKFGRPRPPQWLKRKGHLWVSIWQKLCLERQASTGVIDQLLTPQRQRAYLEGIIQVIRAKMPWCGVKHEEIPRSFLTPEDDSDVEFADPAPAQPARHGYEHLLLLLSALVNPAAAQQPALLAPLEDKLNALKQQLELDSEDILLLRLVYIEGMKQNQVARSLQLQPYQLNRRLKRVLAHTREAMAAVGLASEDVLAQLSGE